MNGNSKRIVIAGGNGIGPEVSSQAKRVAEWFVAHRNLGFVLSDTLYGLDAYRQCGEFLPEATVREMRAADAVLFGAMGGPELDEVPAEQRRAGSLRAIRRDLDVFANLRPVMVWGPMVDSSSLKRETIEGVDLMIVRELTGGIYFGEPRGIERLPDGRRRGVNTEVYATDQIERVARVAFELARTRRHRVCSVDKANVMESGVLWREEVQRLRDSEYDDVELSHFYVDNCAMQIVRDPRQFDVLLTNNLFGDILSEIGRASCRERVCQYV